MGCPSITASAGMVTPLFDADWRASCFYMMLTDADLETFVTAYEQDFGERISLEEAQEMAVRVLSLFELLATEPDR